MSLFRLCAPTPLEFATALSMSWTSHHKGSHSPGSRSSPDTALSWIACSRPTPAERSLNRQDSPVRFDFQPQRAQHPCDRRIDHTETRLQASLSKSGAESIQRVMSSRIVRVHFGWLSTATDLMTLSPGANFRSHPSCPEPLTLLIISDGEAICSHMVSPLAGLRSHREIFVHKSFSFLFPEA